MKLREFWIKPDGYEWDGYEKWFVMNKDPGPDAFGNPRKEYIHVREVIDTGSEPE